MIPLRDDQPRTSTPYLTYALIVVNVVIFFFEAALPLSDLNGLIFQLGVVPSHFTAVITGSSRVGPVAALVPLLTSMFLHGSWMHVIGNMWFLWIFGDNIEDYLGHLKYLAFYLVSGIIAALAQIALTPHSHVPTVGASGAIAGVLGAYFLLYPKARVFTWFPPVFFFHISAWIMLGYWFIIQFLSGTATSITAANSSQGGIAFWAHVGGFLAGAVMIKLLPRRVQPYRYGTT
jgi:membrane associated rhomboid family serine protease